MKMSWKRILYLLLCVAGTILPYSQLIPFLREHGLNMPLFFQQLFANRISGSFGLDVIVSFVALGIFIVFEGTRLRIRHLWVCFASVILVGVSLGLPLFLLMRQSKLEESSATEPSSP